MAIARPTCGESLVWLSVLVFQPRVLCWFGVHSTGEGKERLASHLLDEDPNLCAQAVYRKWS